MKLRNVLCLILAMLLTLAGCGGTTDADTAAVQDTAAETVAETAETEILPDLPDVTFGGAEFTVLKWDAGNGIHDYFEFDTEELNGELLNDSIYNRNLEIEERYDVTIGTIAENSPQSRLSKDVTAGETPYQVVTDWPTKLSQSSTQGHLLNLYTVPYVDLEKPWWDQNAVDAYSIGGKLYVTTGDYVLYDKQRILVVFFNHDMADDMGIPDLYDMVWEGKWTIDRMNSYTTQATIDLDGDGKLDPVNDQFGMISGSNTYLPYLLFGMESTYSRKEADNTYALAITSEHTINAIESLAETFYTENTIWWEDCHGKLESMWIPFQEGRGLFYHEVSQCVRLFDMEEAFGILPQPKYNEEQENYLTSMQSEWSSILAVPSALGGDTLEMTGVLL
ncbi:MAG: hypothetical protein IKV57_06255, partial [Clostridia bacterium]|nr:hypothetical protein [Clostridia bacterium]